MDAIFSNNQHSKGGREIQLSHLDGGSLVFFNISIVYLIQLVIKLLQLNNELAR